MTERILPPAPPPSSPSRGRSAENDFWAGLFVDLSVRIEWLEQALDAVPREDASAEALVRLRAYSRAVTDLLKSLGKVQGYRQDPRLKPLFVLDGPLAGFLSRLYGWCEEIGNDFERMAVALRKRQPTSVVFSHKSVNKSYADFNALMSAMRRTNEAWRANDGEMWPAFEESLEELIWATEWVHMALARPPGE